MPRALPASSTTPYVLAVLIAGCGGGTPPVDAAGVLQLSLELGGGVQIDEVSYEISGNGMAPMGGVIDTSAPGATASVEVFGIPPGDGYLVEMMATSVDGDTMCKGSTTFDVDVGQVTSVMVMLNCKPPERFGGVRVNGKLNVCAELTQAVVAPLQTSVGSEIDVSAQAFDAEDDSISYRWTPGDSFADPRSPETTYTCTEAGPQSITIEVSDDDFEDCIDTWTVAVDCVGEGPDFVAGPAVTVSGPSPFAECVADFDPDQIYWLDSEVEPWVAVDPTNPDHIATAWQQDRYSNGGCRGNVAGTSFDGGASWEVVVIPGLTPCSGGRWDRVSDPWLAFASNGDLYSASLAFFGDTDAGTTGNAIVVNKSVDGGRTWSDPVTVDEQSAPLFNDKESITADPEDACTLYVTWFRANDFSVDLSGVTLMSRTTDCGETWGEPRVIAETEIVGVGLQIVIMPDGSLRAFSAPATGGGNLMVQQSIDQGDTWSEPVPVASIRRARPFTVDFSARIRSGDLNFDVGADRDTGYLYVVWEQLFAPGLFPVQVAFSSSTDGGLTWSMPIRIDQTPAYPFPTIEQAFLPSVEVSDEGTIGVTYYNFQNSMIGDLPTSRTDHWFVHCNPAEADCTDEPSWAGSELRLTPESFDYLLAPGVDPLFLGDYLGLATAGSDFFAFFSATTVDDPANAIFVPIRAR